MSDSKTTVIPGWEGIDTGDPRTVVQRAVELYGDRLTLANSFSYEDVTLVHLLHETGGPFRVFALDTGRLPEETYRCADRIRSKYRIDIEWYFPRTDAVETLERAKGLFSFMDSVENRKDCCFIRKVEPLNRALKGMDAWMTGQRRAQSVTRGDQNRCRGSASKSESTSTSETESTSDDSDSTSDASDSDASQSDASDSANPPSTFDGSSSAHSDSQSEQSHDSRSDGSDTPSIDDSDFDASSDSRDESDSNEPSGSRDDSNDPSVDDPSVDSRSDDDSGDPPSEDESTDEPSHTSSEGSSEPCNSTWVWSCGWELVDSDCEDPGEPPSSSGAYDGEVAAMTA